MIDAGEVGDCGCAFSSSTSVPVRQAEFGDWGCCHVASESTPEVSGEVVGFKVLSILLFRGKSPGLLPLKYLLIRR